MNQIVIEKQSFIKRMWQYQKERFPIVAHGLLITAFTFSAISYSRLCRGAEGFISMEHFVVGVLTTFCLFFGMRALDEVKDKETDAKYRTELPVPRGLVTIREISKVSIVLSVVVLGLIVFYYPKMLWLMLIVLVWLTLMTFEFFIPKYINARLPLYAASHMVIIPLIDVYASGLDWFISGATPHFGLLIFFAVSYFNGMVLEVGRKIKAPMDEKEGVQTYTAALGTDRGVVLWMILTFVSFVLSSLACLYVGLPVISIIILAVIFLYLEISGLKFFKSKSSKTAARLESASGVWALCMYLIIGGLPGLIHLF